MSVAKRVLFLVWHEEAIPTKKFLTMENFVFGTVLKNLKYTQEEQYEIGKKLRNFTSKLVEKWKNCRRNKVFFENKNQEWLDTPLVLIERSSSEIIGRPQKDISECCKKTQVKKLSGLTEDVPSEALLVAASCSLYKGGKRSASQVVSMLNADEEFSGKILKTMSTPQRLPTKFSDEKALALFVDVGHTKYTWNLSKRAAKGQNADIYPCYDKLRCAKKKCYPSVITVTDHFAEVPLQSLVDHTIARIIEAHPESFQNHIENNNNTQLTATYKWGCDGSSGHSTYRQKFNDFDGDMIDQYLFSICMVPLIVQKGPTVLWKNNRPCSTRYCRPIKLLCEKESADLSRREIQNIKSQILNIFPTFVSTLRIDHQFHMTMLDGKTFSVISESASQTCGICSATPKNMNDLNLVKSFPINGNLFEYGLSSLHAWIRFFECVLHIAYRIPIQKWQARGADKDVVEQNKRSIQQKLREEMHLLVDIPMAGTGSTNNGNTARRFFQQPNLAARITGVSYDLIYRFSVVLRALACGYDINSDAFGSYALETAEIFVKAYSWFYMPSSVHRILIHGADIINHFSLPIGMMSEEALEARNKDYRNIRESNTRKNSRKNTMEDIINALLVSSDPLISSLSNGSSISSAKNIIMDDDVKSLLLMKHLDMPDSDSEDSEDNFDL